MPKMLLIAIREYLAFVRTVGFWLSLFTLPLIICAAAFMPVLMKKTDPVVTVAVLDLSGEDVGPQLEALIRGEGGNAGDSLQTEVVQGAVDPKVRMKTLAKLNGLRLTPLPASLKGLDAPAAEMRLRQIMAAPEPEVSCVIIALKSGDSLDFHVWSSPKSKDKVAKALKAGLDNLVFERYVAFSGIEPEKASALRYIEANVVSLTPLSAPKSDKNAGIANLLEAVKTNGPHLIGVLISYISWIAIFSSSMILLGSVIEEKASKVMEVLLSSVSTSDILVGKVLGVAMVMLTVFLIWVTVLSVPVLFYAKYIPPQVLEVVTTLIGLFSPVQVALMLIYFIGGYLMYGIAFAAIGAFCETQKDAQAIIGPFMIILIIPMLSLPASIASPDLPATRFLSYVPLFTPILMPIRLAQPLPWWDIALTLTGMWLLSLLMIRLGTRAFRQGALTGGKFSWKLMGDMLRGKGID